MTDRRGSPFRVLRAVLAVLAVAATVTLAGCTSHSGPTTTAYPTSAAVTPTPTPSVTPTPVRVKAEKLPFPIPTTRWDHVPRGPLPAGCAIQGSAVVTVSGTARAYATGPSLTCPASRHYLVRGVVKLAEHLPAGWTYVAHVGPSAPLTDQAPAQLTVAKSCTAGIPLRAVASFVLTWPDGHQLRYKIYGRVAACA